MNPLIELKSVTVGYGEKCILDDIQLQIFPNDYVGIVGPNGSGKTTLLRTILGIIPSVSGTVSLMAPDGKPIRFGYVPQRETINTVLPYTAEQVVAMAKYRQLGIFKRISSADREIIRRSMQHVDIGQLAEVPFKDLSGGQKQRVLIARALAMEPDVLVLDEPTNGMDLSARTAILELIEKLHTEDRLTVILVSHVLSDVADYAHRIVLLEEGIFQVGSVEEILTEKNLSSVYRRPIYVGSLHGSTVIHAGGEHNGIQ